MQRRMEINIRRQRGVVLFIALIALVVLLLASVALVRSTDTAVLLSGNIAVKRDMTNEGEQAIAAAAAEFASGGALFTSTARNADTPAANYSSVMLASNAEGIPNIMFDTNSAYGTVAAATAPTGINGMSFRFVIDRLCSKTGAPDPRYCATGNGGTYGSRSQTNWLPSPDVSSNAVIYRITVRVTDNKQAQSFLQTTLAI